MNSAEDGDTITATVPGPPTPQHPPSPSRLFLPLKLDGLKRHDVPLQFTWRVVNKKKDARSGFYLLSLSPPSPEWSETWTFRGNVSPTFFIVNPRSGSGNWLAAVKPRSRFRSSTKKIAQWKAYKMRRRVKKYYIFLRVKVTFSQFYFVALNRVAQRSRLHTDCDVALFTSPTRNALIAAPRRSVAKSLIGQYGTCPRLHSSSAGDEQPIVEQLAFNLPLWLAESLSAKSG